MSDLISRSALIRNISKVCGDLGIELPDQVIDMITAQPIAYDVEKVVAELEKAKSKAKPWDEGGIGLAIDIVRKVSVI